MNFLYFSPSFVVGMSTERNSECSSVIENKNFFHFRQAMAEDERVDLVSFTGSTQVKFICCVPNYFMSVIRDR